MFLTPRLNATQVNKHGSRLPEARYTVRSYAHLCVGVSDVCDASNGTHQNTYTQESEALPSEFCYMNILRPAIVTNLFAGLPIVDIRMRWRPSSSDCFEYTEKRFYRSNTLALHTFAHDMARTHSASL